MNYKKGNVKQQITSGAVVHAKLQIIRRHVARYAGLTLYPTMPYARHTFAMTTSLA